MILLDLNERNDNVCLTLKEKASIESPAYLFEVYHNKDQKQYFNAPDTSLYPDSYNQFSLKAISTGTPDQTDGEFLAFPTDFWEYTIYEMESEADYDPDNALGVLETGRIRVDTPRPETIEFDNQETVISF